MRTPAWIGLALAALAACTSPPGALLDGPRLLPDGVPETVRGDRRAADAPAPRERSYCAGATTLLELPDDPLKRGPWPVGSRTMIVDGLTVEIWYPARPGSEVGRARHSYDLREHLPLKDPATVKPVLQDCDCYRDLPLDDAHGPFSAVLFVHGFSGFRGQSLDQMTHWASRGFVVLAGDHPSIGLKTFLADGIAGMAFNIIADGGGSFLQPCALTFAKGQTAEGLKILDALHDPGGGLTFLRGHLDLSRLGAAGHSAGGAAVRPLGDYPGVHVVIPMSMAGTCPGKHLQSSLVMGGMEDHIIPYATQQLGYDLSPTKRRLIGLAKAGHMAFTSFCPIGQAQGGILSVAQAAGIQFSAAFLAIIGPLSSDGCGKDSLSYAAGRDVINDATSAALEETLLCLPERGMRLGQIRQLYPQAIGELREALK